MKPVIFLGPSLPLKEAQSLLDAHYLKPVRQGDVLTALHRYSPRVMGIIDGVFYQDLSVWHKEIMFAMKAGVHVFGASSMGALRAAELDVYGMQGVGEVYRLFAGEILTDDDEVALAHGPEEANYRGYSEAMVNLRKTFEAAVKAGVIGVREHDLIVAEAKSIYFPERIFSEIFKRAIGAGIARETIARLRTFCRDHYVDVKRDDAKLLLGTIAALPSKVPPFEIQFDFNHNGLFTGLQNREMRVCNEVGQASCHQIAAHAALHRSDFNEINNSALNRLLVLHLASYFGVEVNGEELKAERKSLHLRLEIRDPEAMAQWLEENDLTDKDFDSFVREAALCRKMQKWLVVKMTHETSIKGLLDQMRWQGLYREIRDEAIEFERDLMEIPETDDGLDFQKTPFREVIVRHMRETDCRFDAFIRDWAETSVFPKAQYIKTSMIQSARVRQHHAKCQRALFDGALS